MSITPELHAELATENPMVFMAVEINLPGYDLRLLDGAGEFPIFGEDFSGSDPLFGVLSGLDAPEDGMGDSAASLSLTIATPTTAAAGTLNSPDLQGSRVRAWVGAIDRSTGQPIPDPYLIFDGELDQPIALIGPGKQQVDYDCVSVFDLLFDNDEGMRLADSFHQSIWPGELGLQNVTGIVRTIIWGPGDSNV